MDELASRLAENEPGLEDITWQYLPAGLVAGKIGSKVMPYLPYLKDIWEGRGLLFHKPFGEMTNKEFENYNQQGQNYYQQYLQNNPANIKNYGQVTFGGKNKGKDFTYNMEQYPFLRKNLESAEYKYTTNYKNEPDRTYDHLQNTHNNKLYEYLIENIKDVGKRYKMIKNK